MNRRILPWLALGPLTGPLAYGMVSCLRARRPVMAAVYGCGLVEVLFGFPLLLTAEIQAIIGPHLPG